MPDDEKWMDELAAKRAVDQAARAREEDREESAAHGVNTALRNDLPALSRRLGTAAEQETERFKEKMGFGRELTCVYDPSQTITMVWSKSPGASLSIQVSELYLGLTVDMKDGDDLTANVNFPSVNLRLSDGRVDVLIDDQIVSPEDAMSRLLRPFFEFVANAAKEA